MKNEKMKSMLFVTGAIILAGLVSGCATRDQPKVIEVKGESHVQDKVLLAKELPSKSLMQNLQRRGEKEGYKTRFTPSSKDVLIADPNKNWNALLIDAQSKKGVYVSGNMFSSGTKKITVRVNSKTVYDDLLNYYTRPNVIKGAKYHGKYIVDYDRYTRNLVSDTYFHKNEPIRLKRFMNKLYGVAKKDGKNIYFGLNAKGNVVYAHSSPIYIRLSPLKRQMFVNYLNTAGIRYVGDKTKVAIADNFDNWVKAMNEVSTYNKYRHQVYGVYSKGGKYYEVADGSYQTTPVGVELVSWNSDGTRTYYIYDKGTSQKIKTNQRMARYKNYTIRFY